MTLTPGEPPVAAVRTDHADRAAAAGAVLASDRFRRAPNLERLLSYLCRRALAEGDGKTTEYDIAFEVLNRSQDFDPATDSIVRVETHRLRKRLADYYRHEGAGDPVQVVIPLGRYTPEFRSRTVAAAGDVDARANDYRANDDCTNDSRINDSRTNDDSVSTGHAKDDADAAGDDGDPPGAGASPWRFGLAAVAAAMVTLAVFASSGSNAMTSGPATASTSAAAVPAASTPTAGRSKPADADGGAGAHAAAARGEVRILAGSTVPQYIDRLGNVWRADAYYHDGVAKPNAQPILRPADPFLFEQRREGNFAYRIPLADGRYRLHLYFAEPRFGAGNVGGGGEGSRVFDVLLNGAPLLTNLDILNDAGGGNIAVEKVFDGVSPGPDGHLSLAFHSVARGPAVLSALAIVPADAPGMPPVRIRCQDTSFTDQHGTFWGADRYFMGGQTVTRPGATDADRPGLYAGERYGNFTYAIPVTPGTYTATLRFSENWFGLDDARGSGVGRRVFNVLVNGRLLIENLDIFKEAGGSHRELVKVFRGVRPDAQQRLVFSFAPVVNYASLNAIEIVRE